MKQRIFFVFFLAIIASLSANASHIFGGDIYYKNINGNTYEVTLVLYGDCSGNSYPNLLNASPNVKVSNGGTLFTTLVLQPFGTQGLEVSPVCPSQINNTTCNGGNLPGVGQFIFKKTVTLNSSSANWNFLYDGTFSGGNGAGRSNAITNVVQGNPATIMQLEATLNNINGPNDSPVYSVVPTPFFCINTMQEYNQGAVDPNNDNLTFNLVPGFDKNSASGFVTYISPYSYTSPLATNGNYSFNNANGQMSFYPNAVQNSLVVMKVTETKNGVVVGTSMREMTFVVLGNCNNQSPAGVIASTNAGNVVGTNEIQICDGVDTAFDFHINSTDPDNDNIEATVFGLPANSTATITGNNTPSPVINIHFAVPTPFAIGSNTFYITFKDDGCPLTSKQTIAYTISFVQPISTAVVTTNESCNPKNDGQIIPNATSTFGTVSYSLTNSNYSNTDTFKNLTAGVYTVYVKDSKNCTSSTTATIIGSQSPNLQIDAINDIKCFGQTNGSVKVSTSNSTSNSYTLLPINIVNSSGIFSNLSQSNYSIIVSDNKQCKDTIQFSINEPPPIQFDNISVTDLTCNEKNGKVFASSNFADSVYFLLKPCCGAQSNGVFENLDKGIYNLVVVNKNGCKTDTTVTVGEIPFTLTSTITKTDLPCLGNGTEGEAEIFVSGGVTPYTYLWTSNPVQTTAKINNLYYGWYFVTVTDAQGCSINNKVKVEPGNCCTSIFAADAFTPNGDGQNDDWGIVTSTGMEVKQFFVVNRWGEKIWEANDQRARWNGKQKTGTIENGTYYYLLKYKCLSDNKIYFKKGDLTVIH